MYFCPRRFVLVLANSADPDEKQYNAAFHLGLHCLPMYPFRSLQYTMGLYYVYMFLYVHLSCSYA